MRYRTAEVTELLKFTYVKNQNCTPLHPMQCKIRYPCSFDTTCIWDVCISKQSKVSKPWNKLGWRRWLPRVLPTSNEVRSTNPWEPSRKTSRTLKIGRRKCTKSSVTQPRIIRFRSNLYKFKHTMREVGILVPDKFTHFIDDIFRDRSHETNGRPSNAAFSKMCFCL